jgi:iron complex outermembrane recepter protein
MKRITPLALAAALMATGIDAVAQLEDVITEDNEGYVEGTLGNYDSQRYVASSSGPISDSPAYRLAGSWHNQNGWMEKPGGDDLNAATDWNTRGKLLWQASDALSVLLTGSHVDRDTS